MSPAAWASSPSLASRSHERHYHGREPESRTRKAGFRPPHRQVMKGATERARTRVLMTAVRRGDRRGCCRRRSTPALAVTYSAGLPPSWSADLAVAHHPHPVRVALDVPCPGALGRGALRQDSVAYTMIRQTLACISALALVASLSDCAVGPNFKRPTPPSDGNRAR